MFELRQFQKEALKAFTKPAHVICVAPTGSGKSLIYEKLAAQPDVKTLLITPLIALARQQAKKLVEAGVTVRLFAGERARLTPGQAIPGAEAWIISPETLTSDRCQEELQAHKPDLLVVDECHCLWEWGENFRPAFAKIPELLRAYPIQRSLWLTATLPLPARQILREQLPKPLIEIGDFQLPPRLSFHCMRVPWADRAEAALEWVHQQNEAGIVFAPTRGATERLQRLLKATGKDSWVYHAGLSREERKATENLIQNGRANIIIATSAFGMGMDYSHLRWVLLWQAFPSLLSIAQAIGRVGRGQEQGNAMVFWDDDDFSLLEWMAAGSERRKNELRETHLFFRKSQCRRKSLKTYFDGETSTTPATCGGHCDFCR